MSVKGATLSGWRHWLLRCWLAVGRPAEHLVIGLPPGLLGEKSVRSFLILCHFWENVLYFLFVICQPVFSDLTTTAVVLAKSRTTELLAVQMLENSFPEGFVGDSQMQRVTG